MWRDINKSKKIDLIIVNANVSLWLWLIDCASITLLCKKSQHITFVIVWGHKYIATLTLLCCLQVRYKVAIFQMIIELMDNQQANYRVCRVHYMLTFLLACEDREMLQIDGKFACICMLIFKMCHKVSSNKSFWLHLIFLLSSS